MQLKETILLRSDGLRRGETKTGPRLYSELLEVGVDGPLSARKYSGLQEVAGKLTGLTRRLGARKQGKAGKAQSFNGVLFPVTSMNQNIYLHI